MKFDGKKWLSGFLVLSSVLQTPMLARAQMITDLPNPDEEHETFDVPSLPSAPSVQTVQTGWTMLEKVSRRTGGDLFTIKLQRAVPLMRLEVRVDQSKVNIIETTLITSNGNRIAVRELTRTGIVERGTTRVSENLNLQEAVESIEVRMESHSAEATVLFSALSDHEYPRLTATRAVVQVPQTPQAPPAPVTPSTPSPRPAATPTPSTASVPGNATHPGKFSFNVGDKVVSDGKYSGVIVAINRNGDLQIRDDDDRKVYPRKKNQVVKAVTMTSDGRFKAGVKVLSDGKYDGVVVGVFSDGNILVRDSDDNKEYLRSAAQLVTEVKCDRTGVYCAGTKVISDGKYSGRVVKVYSNGTILIKDDDDGKNYPRSASQIRIPPVEKSCNSRGNNCKGTKVVSDQKYFGVVVSYVDGKIRVRDSDDGKLYERDLNQVVFEIKVTGKYAAGNRVLSDNKYAGTIIASYTSGKLSIRDDDDKKLFLRDKSSVVLEVKCAKNICAGSRVIAGRYTGTVKVVYSNNVVLMRDDDDGKNYPRAISELRLLK